MQTHKIINKTKNITLLDKVIMADTFFSRLKGLMGKKSLDKGEGIIIKPCSSIHSFGMKMAIDVAFIDKDNQVIHILSNFKPRKMSPIIKGSKYVIEASANLFKDKLEVKDIIEVI